MSLNLIISRRATLADFHQRVAFASLTDVGWLSVCGPDRVRWLNGMVTNNIAALKPGEGSYSFFLNAQGRIQADGTVFVEANPFEEDGTRQPEMLLIETALDRMPALLELLNRFIIMDDVTVEPIHGSEFLSGGEGIVLVGPDVQRILEGFGYTIPLGDSPSLNRDRDDSDWIRIVKAYSPLVPRFEIWGGSYNINNLTRELVKLSVPQAGPATTEQLRILEGTPLYGTDIRNSDTAKDLPQETNQTRALHFSKGCYLGQEIVERIRSRGAVHRTFTGFYLTGDPAPAGTILTADDKPVGELTSVTAVDSKLLTPDSRLIETSTRQIALGYIRREALDRAATITYPGGTAIPTTLPFQLSESRA